MKKELILFKFAFFGVTFGSMNLPSPRSPRDRKTKSPGSFSSDSSSFSPIPFAVNPRHKRVKVIFKNDDDQDEIEVEDAENNLINEESPQSITLQFRPRPILKRHLKISRKYLNSIHLFRNGSVEDIMKFYSQGTQLSGDLFEVNEMFKFLLETGQVEKLRLLYEHEKVQLLDFIMKGFDVNAKDMLELISIIFSGNEELILMIQGEANLFKMKTIAFLYAVEFKTELVYKMFNELIDDVDENDRLILAGEIINLYYKNGENMMPLLVYAAKNDSEETVQSILAFAPEEATRLDSNGFSFIYQAACEGNLGILNGLKEFLKGKPIPGQCPLIGAALNFRDDSLTFFLEDENSKNYFNFTEKDIEDAQFATAVSGSLRSLRVLKRNGVGFNLYCYRGGDTLLSTALKNNQIGYATSLIEEFKYDINFVGEDSINPEGNALTFVLDKLTTCELFLKKGANRNILIPKDLLTGSNGSTMEFFTLKEYLEMCGNAKLIQLFNKY